MNPQRTKLLGVGPIDVQRVRQLLGKAFLDLVFTDQIDEFTDGRYLNAHMERVLDATESTCSILGCDGDLLEADHNCEVRDGGETRQSNMHKICGPHHAIKTKYRMKLAGPPGRMRLIKLDTARAGRGSRAGPS